MKLNRILAGLCLAVCLTGAANAATLLPNAKQQFISANGAPLAGGTVQFYIPGTTTPKDTWQDAGQTILNTNPVVLDAAGRATIYGSGSYRQIVRDAQGNLIWDQLSADISQNATSWAGRSTGSANSQAVSVPNFNSSDGQAIAFVAGFTNTGALTLNPNGTGAINVVNDTPSGAVTLSGGEVVAGNVVQATYSATSGTLHIAVTPSTTIPTGIVQEYAGATPPPGFIFANGACVSRATFSRLFSVIGTNYGACDGTTTFAVPDKRGRVGVGKDDMGGFDAGRLAGAAISRLTLGGAGGEAIHTLSIAELPVVTPTGTVSVTFPGVNYDRASISPSGGSFGASGVSYSMVYTPTVAYAGGTSTFNLSMGSFGSGAAHNLLQPSIIMNFIIKT